MGDDIVEKIKLAKMEVERIKAEIKKNKEEMNDTTRTFFFFCFKIFFLFGFFFAPYVFILGY